MANNKIQLADGTTLIDLTNDSVTADKLAKGYTAHDASGNPITGTMESSSGSGAYDITVTDNDDGTQSLDITDAEGGSAGGQVFDEVVTLSEAVNEWSIDVPEGITDVKLRIVMPAVEANMTYGYILTNGAQSNFVTINWGNTSGEIISGVSWLVFKNGTIGQILAGNGAYWNSLDSFKNAVKDVTSLTSIGIKAYGSQTFPVGTKIAVRGRS